MLTLAAIWAETNWINSGSCESRLRLVRLAAERYGDVAELPFSEIVQGMAAWKTRRRHAGDAK